MAKNISGIKEIDAFSNRQPVLPQRGGPVRILRAGRGSDQSAGFVESSLSEGGGGDFYAASAVNFDGNTWLSINSLDTAATTQSLSFSFWIKAASANDNPSFFQVDPNNNYTSGCSFTPNTSADSIRVGLYDQNGSSATSVVTDGDTTMRNSAWNHILFSGVTSGSGSNVQKIYINDIDHTGTINDQGSPFDMIFDGLEFVFANDGFGPAITADIADVWIAPNVSLLSGGDISETNRRKFIDANGKPVDPSNWPDAAIKFYGNAANFATNHGTGGDFTTTGALTDASTSPSD